jgi:hypothetical protein
MSDGRVKEVTVGTCAICGKEAQISFWSLTLCSDCVDCPHCESESHCYFKSYSYLCVESGKKVMGIRCTHCGNLWRSREEFDAELTHRAQTTPRHICKVCGDDVYHAPGSPFNHFKHKADVCTKCQRCPHCKEQLLAYNFGSSELRGGPGMECNACGGFWDSPQTYEEELLRTYKSPRREPQS